MIATILPIARIQSQRHPDLGPVVHDVCAAGQDADDFARQPIDFDRLPDDVFSSAERGLPELVGEDGERRKRNRR